ncbi:MAG TPA: PadR family transcriptional regulator [Acidimicrobiales bacterium]|nr:PadR family transcriptional regulator [Acidimicrobiales bacterium]
MSSPDINATAASLLGFLSGGEMTGWDLDRTVRETIGNFWNVTRSQVYRELRTLAELGYVETGDTGRRDRRPYRITDAGRSAFNGWIARDPGQPIIRMPFLLTVFFGAHLPPGRLDEILASQRADHERALEEFRAVYARLRDGEPFVAEVVRFAIGYNEHALAWIDGFCAGAPDS